MGDFMSNARRLLNNTAMLTATALIMRTVGVSFNIYLTRILGASGMGLFQLITAVYSMGITFSCAGVRLASMRLVADSIALKRDDQRNVMRLCLFYGLGCGCIIGLTMFFMSEIIAVSWIGNPVASPCVKILSISLPFVSMSSALNGYFTSESKIMRYTWVQILEQLFKIGVTVFLFRQSVSNDIESLCSNIVIGITGAEIFSLSLSYGVFLLTSKKERLPCRKNTLRNLLRIALPDATGAEIRSVLSTVEHMLIPKGLKKYGGNVENSMGIYGIVHGMTLPIILYPGVLISSLSGLLVPEISYHLVSSDHKRISYIIKRVLHLTLIFSVGVAGIIFFNAERLSFAFYSDNQCEMYIKILSPLIVVMYMDMSVDGMLKGLDQQLSYMKYNIIDAGFCVAFVYFFVPVLGVKGYLFVIYLSEIINFVLSFRRLSKVSDVYISPIRDIVIPLICIAASGLTGAFFSEIFTLGYKADTISVILIQGVIYLVLLRASHCIDKEEEVWVKKLFFNKN